MKKYLLVFAIIVLILLFWFYGDRLFNFLPLKEVFESQLEQFKKEIFNPPPLVGRNDYQESFLTESGILTFTNEERQKQGLPILKVNAELTAATRLKAEDMIKNQYFAHTSPTGEGVDDLAEKVGYQYIMIGENLAMGNFKDDNDLVQAWMASPGHRANILNPKYKEIGIGVARGEFEGKTTWFAVQHFGTPLSSCPEPDADLKARILANQAEISSSEAEIDALLARIKTLSRWSGEYAKEIQKYNALVDVHNNIVSETKAEVTQYNMQVDRFNICVKNP